MAEQARLQHGVQRVVAVLDAHMDEVYAAHLHWQHGQWRAESGPVLGAPEHVQAPAGWTVAGNAQAAYPTRLAPRDRAYGRPATAAAGCGWPRPCWPQARTWTPACPGTCATRWRKPRRNAKPCAWESPHERRCHPLNQAPEARLGHWPGAPGQVLAIEGHPHPTLVARRQFTDALASGCVDLLLGGDRVLGFFVAMRGVEGAHLLNLTVAPAFQRRGWGQITLDALALWLRGEGLRQWLVAGSARGQHGPARCTKPTVSGRVGLRKLHSPLPAMRAKTPW